MPHSSKDEKMIEDAYRARSAELRTMAENMSADLRDTILDAAEHWETLAKQAETVARSKRLIRDWERKRDSATGASHLHNTEANV